MPAAIHPEFFSELPRYRKLSRFRQYLDSTQYEGQPDFFTGRHGNSGEPVPLRERKPCVIYALPRSAVAQVVRFTFGESRFPSIGFGEIRPAMSVAGETLSKDEAQALEQFTASLIESCDIKPTIANLMTQGLALGTTCAILSVKQGRIVVDIANAEDMLPEFRDGDPNLEVLRAVWCYKYLDTVEGADGRPQQKQFWFRQDIDAKTFTEFERVPVVEGQRPEWRISRVVKHKFGFCPVVWIRNTAQAQSRDMDGTSLYDNLLEEFDALNFALSQRHRGINILGTPQPWETGVDEGDGPQQSGRTSGDVNGGPRGYSSRGVRRTAGSSPARPSGAASLWSYRSHEAKVGLLETTGKAFEAATNHVNDIRGRSLESMGVVLVNISEVMGKTHAGEMSAKFLELAYEPLLALVDQMRHCWWPHGLRAILSAALRIVAATNGDGVYIPGAKQVAAILNRFVIRTQAGPMWLTPPMVPSWGDYFSAGQDEIATAVTTAQAAKEAHLVPAADASKFVLPYFGREHDAAAAAEQAKQEENSKVMIDALKSVHEIEALHAASGHRPRANEAA